MPEDADQPRQRRLSPRRRWIAAGAALVVVTAGALFAVERPTPGGADTVGSAHHQHHSSHPDAPSTTTSTLPPPPLSVVSMTPANGSKGVPYLASVTLRFSAPLATDAPDPTLSPAVAGSWSRPNASTLVFTPSERFVPSTLVHVNVPADLAGKAGQTLAAPYVAHFGIAPGSNMRLEQLLAELGYLPVRFVPAGAPATSGSQTTAAVHVPNALGSEPTDANLISLEPLAGSFAWRYSDVPAQLSSLWDPAAYNVVTEGAVMAFEQDHGLATDGQAGPQVWGALLKAVAARQVTARPYDYLLVTESAPESLFVWSDGRVVYDTLANTGVPGATTALGTWPVYLRYTSTTMSGTNPDGSHYSDPGVPWVSYFNGSDAVHGFVRSYYGFPQSDGCVELPVANADRVFPLDPIGTLVTVTTGDLASELGVPPLATDYPPPTTTTVPVRRVAPKHSAAAPRRNVTPTTAGRPHTTSPASQASGASAR